MRHDDPLYFRFRVSAIQDCKGRRIIENRSLPGAELRLVRSSTIVLRAGILRAGVLKAGVLRAGTVCGTGNDTVGCGAFECRRAPHGHMGINRQDTDGQNRHPPIARSHIAPRVHRATLSHIRNEQIDKQYIFRQNDVNSAASSDYQF